MYVVTVCVCIQSNSEYDLSKIPMQRWYKLTTKKYWSTQTLWVNAGKKPARPFQKAGICVFDLNWVFCALGGEKSTLNHFLTLFQATATYYVDQYTKTCNLNFFTNNTGIFALKHTIFKRLIWPFLWLKWQRPILNWEKDIKNDYIAKPCR